MIRTELRRGTAPLAAALTAVAMTWMLMVHPEDWAGRWTSLSTYLRVSLLILCPLFVAAGAWQAGRERRTQLEELLGSVPRPAWQPLLATWAAVTLGGLAGLALPLAVAAVLVGLRASHLGTGWWWIALVAVVALATASALGTLVGRLVPARVVAPVAGLAVYLGLAVPMYFGNSPWAALAPNIGQAGPADVWPLRYHLWQAGWLLALGAVLFLLAARRWGTAVVPTLLAAALLVVPARAERDFGEPGRDPGALALVCTDRVPQVCVTRVHEFLLADVVAVVEPTLARLAGIPGAPVRAVDDMARPRGLRDHDVLWLSLTQQATLTGGVARRDLLLADFTTLVQDYGCLHTSDVPDAVFETTYAASQWLQGNPPAEMAGLSESRQREWIAEVLAAARACDRTALVRLSLS